MKKLHDEVEHSAVGRAMLQFVERPHSFVFRDKKVAESARQERPGGRFTLKSRRKLLKRDVAYENVGTVKISAFTCNAFSLTFSLLPSLSRVYMPSLRVLPAELHKELDRSCMIETDCGFHLAISSMQKRESAGFP